MRESLYYKDDDVRLSFLHGNYVTLTNLSKSDIAKIIKLRLSPINVSVHTVDPKLREYMIGRRDTNSFAYLKKLAKAGIKLNCQIVCCPGVNDGEKLFETLKGLYKLGESIHSVSVVPVGLTKHRQGLAELRAFDKLLARKTVRLIERCGEICRKKRGRTVFYCADELYMLASLKLPSDKFYEDYPQLENGVGMMRLFITEFEDAKKAAVKTGRSISSPLRDKNITLVTGTLAAPYLRKLLHDFSEKCDTMSFVVKPIVNNFFGETVTVSGLVTGGDIIAALRGIKPESFLFIPRNMLRHGDDVFLDDITISDISEALNVKVKVLGQNGAELFNALQSAMSCT